MKMLLSPLMRYICQVAEDGSIRKASEYLHISASAINRQIINFEELIGAPIFERLPRGMKLTDAGRVIYGIIKDFEKVSDAAVSEVSAIKGKYKGHVAIGTIQTLAGDFFAEFLASSRKENPDVSFSLFSGNTDEIVRKIVGNELDIGICWEPPEQVPVEKLRVYSMEIGIAMHPSHPLAQEHDLSLQECRDFPIIFPSGGMEIRKLLDRINVGRQTSISPAVTTNAMPLIRLLALSGTGVAVTTRISVASDVSAGALIFKTLRDVGTQHLRLAVLHRQALSLPSAARMLCTAILHALDDYLGPAPHDI
ncbi:HTH-type transcriptional regulator GltC [Variovorax sp. PBS-H4]|uniref:LysR family transcriptional regulator n=1 Tax=Variovorax sp. PBS-H4 TaxID=434008 RepID=UPI001317C71E|nr:LysR family transcriptional regulator [Variovorax sp. PBS-H4]VTU40263.1 HTH-type transcriptional regulator GltC [Variovorax sp. PBS-H4]